LHNGPSSENHHQQSQEKHTATEALVQVSESQYTTQHQDEAQHHHPYRNCIYHTKIFQGHAEKECRQMPITVMNELPTLNLTLGQETNGQAAVKLNVLFDNCGVISTGFKPYHDQIHRLHPDIVHTYESFDDPSNPFYPIKLSGALRDPNVMIFIEQDLIPKKDKGAYNHV
jgi:hypothetical protein